VDEDEIMFSFNYIDEEQTKWLKNNTNISVPSKESKHSKNRMPKDVPRDHNEDDVYCPLCCGKHIVINCTRN
jgi:hypothetical protein